MLGLVFAISASLLLSFSDALKKVLTRTASNFQILFLSFFYGSLINLVVLGSGVRPHVEWRSIGPLLALNLLCSLGSEISFIRAIRHADFSVAIPLIGAFPPIFAFIGGALFFSELPSWIAFAGIALLTSGAYLILLDRSRAGWRWAPFKAVLTERGPRYMMLCALFFVLSALCQKRIASESSPQFAFTVLVVAQTLAIALAMLWNKQSMLGALTGHGLISVFCGILWGAGITLLMVSMSFTLVVYAATISRVGVLSAILIGRFYFNEQRFAQRMSAAFMIVLGAILVMLGDA